MFKIILLSLLWLWTGHTQRHRFEIKFYDARDSCVRTVNETALEKINWVNQEYTIKKEYFSDIYISMAGHISLRFDGFEALRVELFDFYSSKLPPEDRPYTITINGHINEEKRGFFIISGKRSATLDSFIANRMIKVYLKEQHVDVK